MLLLLEGTYPYVRGGVSKWVHDLLLGMPELRFGIVFLGATADMYGPPQYSLPSNVVATQTHYLLERSEMAPSGPRAGNRTCHAHVEAFHAQLQDAPAAMDQGGLCDLVACLLRPDGIAVEDFLFGKTSWEYICASYGASASDQDFVGYFWTVRSMHSAVFKLARIARGLPKARLLHSVSTGYAGLLGAMRSIQTQTPFLLSEHGIYTKERKIDLQRMALSDRVGHFYTSADTDAERRHRMWIRFFQGIGGLAYARAARIISLYEGNRRRQIQDGAPEAKTRVIPNGITIGPFAQLRAKRRTSARKVVGFLGRLVPIKDVKSFVRAMYGVCAHCPEAEGWLIGPEEEDPDYVKQCRDLVRDLLLDGRVQFLGFQDPKVILPKVDVLVLSSISEAFPLVILEAWASGLPVVATDVGACRDLIEGSDTNGKALGRAGRIVPIADPESIATAVLELLNDGDQWRAAQQAGIQRVERYYRQEDVLSQYRGLYREAMR